jgi:hypothetical protein
MRRKSASRQPLDFILSQSVHIFTPFDTRSILISFSISQIRKCTTQVVHICDIGLLHFEV